MNPETWQKVEELLNAVLEIKPSKRRDFLDKIGVDEVRSEVESLLEGESQSGDFLASPAIAFSSDFFDDEEPTDALVGQTIGNYRIVGELGKGGMGAVYLGERTDGKFEQQVAVKLLKRELNTADIRRRFRHERQILAALTHPNIARLLDAGTTADGLPFLVMEYVDGLPVDKFCERQNLDLNERLELFRTVCEAVSFAHRNLIVHRDLKPSNILVTPDGVPKLLDFGISKLLTSEFEAVSEHTVTNLGVMTPAYAAPEQMQKQSVTTATDIYSLGVILYELLSGNRPFDDGELRDIYKAVIEAEPLPPSKMVKTAAKSLAVKLNALTEPLSGENQAAPKKTSRTKRNDFRNTAPQTIGIKPQFLRGDLDNIVLKALKKEPHRRYSSVEQFSEDIRRHLADLPVAARPDTLSYRAAKFFSRNKIAVSAAALIFMTLIGGIVATVWQMRRAEANRIRAEKRFDDVRRLSNALLFELSPKIERLAGATEAREILVKRALEYLDSLAAEAEGDLSLQAELAAAYEKIGDLQGNPSNPNFVDAEAASESFGKARAIRLKLLEKKPSDFENRRGLAENHRVTGKIRGHANDFQVESENLETALRIYETLLTENPASVQIQFAVAETLYDLGRNRTTDKSYPESFPYFERAIERLENLRRENPPRTDIIALLGNCRTDYGNALSWDGKQPAAEAETERAVELLEQAVAENPNDVNLRTALWFAHWLSASTYEEQKDELSHKHAARALQIIEGIVNQDAANVRAKQLWSKSLSMVGQTLINTGKPEEAILYLERARQVSREIIESRTKNIGLKHDLTNVIMRLGEAKFKQKKFADALADYEQAVNLHQEVLRNFPDDSRTKRNLALTYESIAETHQQIGGRKSPKAREYYQKTFDILSELEAQNLLGEFDRKFLAEIRKTLQNFER